MKNYLIKIIEKALKELNYGDASIEVNPTNDINHGDFTSNVAMKLASALHKKPYDVANEIADKIDDAKIKRVVVAGPGFLNFYLDSKYLFDNVDEILKEKDNYGKSNIGNNEHINIEYVSANPTGYLHIGHARGAAYGDALARIKTFTGYKVTREYYINDAGKQMDNLGLSIQARYYELFGRDAEIPENGYQGEEIKKMALELKDRYSDSLLDEDIKVFKKFGDQKLLDKIKEDLEKFNVEFDVWSSETELYTSKKVENVIAKLKDSGMTYEEDGALYLKTTKYGDDKDRVIIKKDGTYTYFLPDIAYHLSKFNRGDKLIDVLGADHHGYINRIKAGVASMGANPDNLEIKILQMVRMVRDGEEVKMSKRTGNAYTMQDLIADVGVNAARYFFAAKSLDTQMDFDLDLATKKSNDNPVYYINYAYARINSILREYHDDVEVKEYTTIDSMEATELLNKLYNFKDVVNAASVKEEPHVIANYLYELATLFHSYYGKEKVLTADPEYTAERINIIKATAIVINNALKLIGVNAVEEM